MTNWKSILKMPITDDMNEVDEIFMLKDNVWREAGGKGRNGEEGFRFAHLDDIEEILDRKLTIDDFTNAPVNWLYDQDVILDRIGKEGVKKLAQSYLEEDGGDFRMKQIAYQLVFG